MIAHSAPASPYAVLCDDLSGEWVCLNGNQIGLLFADYVWAHYKASHPPSEYSSAFMLNSTVSSSILARMAKREGFLHEDTLTGFKLTPNTAAQTQLIAPSLIPLPFPHSLLSSRSPLCRWMGNRADELIGQGKTFLFAFEVEIGYLVGDISLDKDGVRCAAIFYELAAQLHSQGKTCMGRVEELERELGASYMLNQSAAHTTHHHQRLPTLLYRCSFISSSYPLLWRCRYCICNDPHTFEAIFSRIRTMGPQGGYPTSVGGYTVASVRDVPLGIDTQQADGQSRLPRITDSFMITLRLEGGANVTLRNSGTEPKLKFYVEAFDDTREKAKAMCQDIKARCVSELLQPEKNGLTLPK